MTDGKVFFGQWKIEKQIGKGSYGMVYKIYREEYGKRYEAAMKTLSIVPTDDEIAGITQQGLNAEAFFKTKVDKLIDEIDIMAKLKGYTNIVNYEDHQIIRYSDRIGWDIYIRMELLTPFDQYMHQIRATQYDVIRMWGEIAQALMLLESKTIIHRDIKPANILVSKDGFFKLGDFGIARELGTVSVASTKAGSEQYMAPEVYASKADKRSDIYSLGLVIYHEFNKKRGPFLPLYPEPFTHIDAEAALSRRNRGEALPPIPGINPRIQEVLNKSTAYNPGKRYRSASELLADITRLLEIPELRQIPVFPYSTEAWKPDPHSFSSSGPTPNPTPGPRRMSFGMILAAGTSALCVIAAVGIIVFIAYNRKDERQVKAAVPTTAAIEIMADSNAETLAPFIETTFEPTPAPTEEPTQEPTEEPTQEPTEEPTQEPTEEPTQEPTEEPTQEPTEEPTQEPTEEPTQAPTEEPTQAPTPVPIAEIHMRGISIDGVLREEDGRAVIGKIDTLLDWTAEGEVSYYNVYIEDTTAGAVMLDKEGVASSSTTISGENLMEGHTYRVIVDAIPQNGTIEDAVRSEREFTVERPEPTPSPAPITTPPPTVEPTPEPTQAPTEPPPTEEPTPIPMLPITLNLKTELTGGKYVNMGTKTVLFEGTASPNSELVYKMDGVEIEAVFADEQGYFAFEVDPNEFSNDGDFIVSLDYRPFARMDMSVEYGADYHLILDRLVSEFTLLNDPVTEDIGTVNGKTEPGATVYAEILRADSDFYDDDAYEVVDYIYFEDGQFYVELPDCAEGDRLYIWVEDLAGNLESMEIVIQGADRIPIEIEVEETDIIDGYVNGNVERLVFKGKATSGKMLEISIGGSLYSVDSGDGAWRFELDMAQLTPGQYDVLIRYEDGKRPDCAYETSFIYDDHLDLFEFDGPLYEGLTMLSGRTEAGATVYMIISGAQYTAPADENGIFAVSVEPLRLGQVVEVFAADLAGNIEERTYEVVGRPKSAWIDVRKPETGDDVVGKLTVTGELLLADGARAAYDIERDGQVLLTVDLNGEALTAMSEDVFYEASSKHEAEVAASSGYKIKSRVDVSGFDEGSYTIRFYAVDAAGERDELEEREVRLKNSEHLQIEVPGEETRSLTVVNSDGHYAIGMDDQQSAYVFSSDQVVLTGWFLGTEKSTYILNVEIDGVLYSEKDIAEKGGHMRVIRTYRELTPELYGLFDGEPAHDRAGFILELDLSFLGPGDHEIGVVEITTTESVDSDRHVFAGIPISIDADKSKDDGWVERIVEEWAPEPEEESDLEIQAGGDGGI